MKDKVTKKFSKKHEEEQICPSCGEWKTTDFTPEELQEREWECSDCMNKRLTHPEDLPENRGQKEISKYDPAYDFLKRLINLVVKEGVPPQEIKAITLSNPFRTIDDLGDLTAKIWTLATEKYHIPREWLIKRLPEKKVKSNFRQASSSIIKIPRKNNVDVLVYKNPTPDQAENLLKQSTEPSLRYSVDHAGNLYMWDAWLLEHEQVMQALGLPFDEEGYGQLFSADDAKRIALGAQNLIKDLSSSKKAALWPGQAASENTLSHEWNSIAYNTLQEADTSVSGPNPENIEAKKNSDFYKVMAKVTKEMMKELDIDDPKYINNGYCGDWATRVEELVPGVKPVSFTIGKGGYPHVVLEYDGKFYDATNPQGVSDLKSLPFHEEYSKIDPNLQGIHWEDTPEEDLPSMYTTSKKKGLSLDKVLQILEQKGPKPIHVDYTDLTIEFQDGYKMSFDQATKKALEVSKSSSAESEEQERNEPAGTGFYDSPHGYDMGKRPQGDESIWPADTWLPRGTEEEESQTWDNIAASLTRPFSKKAVMQDYKSWLDPNGKEYPVDDHINWIFEHLGLLQKKGINIYNLPTSKKFLNEETRDEYLDTLQNIYSNMLSSGWVRITSDERNVQFNIQVNNLRSIPSFVDEFLSQVYDHNDDRTVAFEDGKGTYVLVQDPFPSIQRAVNRELSHPSKISKKKAFLKISKPKSGYVDNGIGYTCGRCEYFNAEKEKCKLVEGTIKSFGCCNFWDGGDREKDKTAEKKSERALTKEEAVYIEYPNVDYRCDECVFFDPKAKTCTKVEGEISPTASCNLWQPISKKQSFSKKELNKVANPPSRFWIAPDGKEFPVAGIHPVWINLNREMLTKDYGITPKIYKNYSKVMGDMIKSGWVRISNEPAGTGFQIEVANIRNIPSYVDDFIAKYYKQSDIILIGDGYSKGVEITDPFPSIQKAVNKELSNPVNAMLKKADVSGKQINDILKLIQSTGGATYNLSQGNLAQTNNFAVSVYKDRERIVPEVDYDTLEGYIVDNQDLLNDPKNSFGAWTSGGKVYLDTIITVPTKEEALQLAHQYNQLAIFDLAQMQEIPVGIPTLSAFSKKELNIVKWADIYKCQDCGEDISESDEGFCSNCKEDQKYRDKVEKQIRPTKKKAEEQILTQEQQDQIASTTSPVYNISLNNFASAVKRGHSKDRALAYAIDSVKNLEKLDPKKLVELANTYLKGLV